MRIRHIYGKNAYVNNRYDNTDAHVYDQPYQRALAAQPRTVGICSLKYEIQNKTDQGEKETEHGPATVGNVVRIMIYGTVRGLRFAARRRIVRRAAVDSFAAIRTKRHVFVRQFLSAIRTEHFIPPFIVAFVFL